jgi:hypothetical protein
MGVCLGVAAAGVIEGGLVVGPLLTIFGLEGLIGLALAPRLARVLATLYPPAAIAGLLGVAAWLMVTAWTAVPSTLWKDAIETDARVTSIFGIEYFVYEYQAEGLSCTGQAPLSGWRTIFGNSPETERVGDTVRVYRTRTEPCTSSRKDLYDPFQLEHLAILTAEFTPILTLSAAFVAGRIGRALRAKRI